MATYAYIENEDGQKVMLASDARDLVFDPEGFAVWPDALIERAEHIHPEIDQIHYVEAKGQPVSPLAREGATFSSDGKGDLVFDED